MKIQFNTDKNIEGNERLSNHFGEVISTGLNRFNSQVTRIEVHLSDENGQKDGQDDQRCMLEARLEGLQPITVTNNADSMASAVKGAVDKMKSALDTAIGKLRDVR